MAIAVKVGRIQVFFFEKMYKFWEQNPKKEWKYFRVTKVLRVQNIPHTNASFFLSRVKIVTSYSVLPQGLGVNLIKLLGALISA